MKKTLRYNYRLNKTAEQAAKLIEFGSYSSYIRGLWNLLLSENIRRHEYNKTFFFYPQMADLNKELSSLTSLHG